MRAIRRAIAAAVVLAAGVTAAPAAALTNVSSELMPVPTGSSSVAVARLQNAAGDDQWRLNAAVVVHNDGPASHVVLQSITVSAGSLSTQTTTFDDPNVSTASGELPVGSLTGSFPLPATATVVVRYVDGDTAQPGTATQSFPLSEFRSKVDGGAYYMPFRQSEVPTGAYWSNFETTDETGHHFRDPAQRYAYDLVMYRWDGSKRRWTTYKAGKPTNAAAKEQPFNYLGDGLGVYAMEGGTVVECRDNLPNQLVGVKDSVRRYGNAIWIRTADGEYAAYAHMQNGSIPDVLCPTQSVTAADGAVVHAVPRTVQAGQLIGKVGNTGNSASPHLHTQISRDAPKDVDDSDGRAGPGLPLEFHRYQATISRNVLAAAATSTFPPPTPFISIGDADGHVLPDSALVRPNTPCALLPVAPGAPEAILLGHAGACLGEHIADLHRQGYESTSLDGGAVGKNTLYDVTARPDRPTSITAAGLDAQQFGARDQQLTDAGFTLMDVDNYLLNGSVRLSGVWSTEEQGEQDVETLLTEAQYFARVHDLQPYGWVPAVVSPVGTANGTYYSVIFRKQFTGGIVLPENVAVSAFGTRFKSRTAAGLIPLWIEGYNLKSPSGTPTIHVVWTGSGNPNYILKSNLTTTQWNTQWPASLAENKATDILSTFALSGAAHFSTIWRGTS